MRYSCSHCQSELTAYLHGELPPRRRKRAAQHLNACTTCYAVYRRMRDFDSDLRADLPRLGQADQRQLNRVWQGVQAGLAPAPSAAVMPQFRLRYGVALVALVIALLVPYSLGRQQALALPLPPTPQNSNEPQTLPPDVVAMATASPMTIGVRRIVSVEPPAFLPNDAPQVPATETP